MDEDEKVFIEIGRGGDGNEIVGMGKIHRNEARMGKCTGMGWGNLFCRVTV